MASRRTRALLLAFAGISLAVLLFRTVPDDPRVKAIIPVSGKGGGSTSGSAQVESATHPERRKVRLRPSPSAITRSETIALLEETVLGDFALEDESLENCVKAFNFVIRKAGVPPDKLRVVIDPHSRQDLSQLRIRKLRLSDATLSDAIRSLCVNTKVYYRVAAGTVILGDVTVVDQTVGQDDSFDPSGSLQRDRASDEKDADDPFGR